MQAAGCSGALADLHQVRGVGGGGGVGKESPVFHCAIFAPKVLKKLWETLHLPESSNADFFCKIRMRQHEQHPKH